MQLELFPKNPQVKQIKKICIESPSATQIVYKICGAPQIDDMKTFEPFYCYLCAGGPQTIGSHVNDWKSTFSEKDRCKGNSQIICVACNFIMARLSPVPGQEPKEGKTSGATFNNVSNWYCDGDYGNGTKGQKDRIRNFMLCLYEKQPSIWFLGIGESGQKHVLPFTPVNYGQNGYFQFDDLTIKMPSRDEYQIVFDMIEMLNLGFSKTEVDKKEYAIHKLGNLYKEVRKFEQKWGYLRNSPWWNAAIWLAQRSESND